MYAMPAAIPVTMPVDEPTVAVAVRLLLHVPPDAVSCKAVVAPMQTLSTPVIGPGSGFTVTGILITHPVVKVYNTVPAPGALEVIFPAPPPRFNTVTKVLL